MLRISWACALFVVTLSAQAVSESNVPAFADYPVKVVSHGKAMPPKLVTAGQRKFRTEIRAAAAEGVNFAGHYTMGAWLSGTGWIQLAVIDDLSGVVYEGPAGPLPYSGICLGGNPDQDKTGVFFEPDSFLLIVRGCPNDKKCGSFYYRWTGAEFQVLKRVPMTHIPSCL
jgi:hypothetical protein